MPKSLNYEGLIPVPDAGPRLLEYLKLQDNRIAQARVSQRLVRAGLERRPELAVRVGGRVYILGECHILDALADELGVLQPPVASSPTNAKAAA